MDIVSEIRENRESGAIRLENEYRSRLMGYALRVCDDRVEAESVVTQAFAEAISRIETLNDPDAFFGWLCGIVANLHNMSVRRKEHGRVFYTDELPDQSMDGDRKVVEAVDSVLLHDAIAALPPDLRESLMLRYFMDLPLAKIAKVLSIPIGTVKSRLHYARIALAMRLGAKLKKPAVALIAAGLLLLSATAAVVVGVVGGSEMETFNGTKTVQEAEATDEGCSAEAVAIPSVQSVSSNSSNRQIKEGKTGMKKSSIVGSFRKLMNGMTVAAVMSLAANGAENDPYIESDGTAGISTGYCLKPTSRIEVDFALPTTAQMANARLFGADYNNSVLKLACGFYVGANNNTPCWVFGFGNASGWSGVWPKDATGDYLFLDTARHTVVYDFPAGRHTFYTGGMAIAWSNDSKTYSDTATRPVTLFATKDAAGAYNRQIKARIYGVKIYEKTGDDYELVRNFVPCKAIGLPGFRTDLASPGFKDLVTGVCIGTEDASDAFSIGGDIYPVETSPGYVATGAASDAQYIDTRYFATDQTRCELDYSLSTPPTANAWLISGNGADSTFGVYVNKDGTAFGLENGGGWGTQSTPLAGTLDVRRTLVLDHPANQLLLRSGTATNYGPVSARATAGKTYASYAIKLGGRFNGGSEFASMKIYGFRIYEAGEPVRNFVPHWRDGTPGLRDTLTGAFITYPGEKGTKLGFGGDIAVEANPYVQTDATKKQYLATGYKPISTTRFELDYALTAIRPRGTWVLFRGNNSGNYFGVYNDGNGFGFINGNGWQKGVLGTTLADAVGIRRTVVLDNVANVCALVTAGVTNGSRSCANKIPATAGGTAVTLSVSEGFSAEYASLRLYACRIYEGGTPVHEYRPAVKDGVPGLQDRLSDTFLPILSKGTSNPYVYGGVFPVMVSQDAQRLSSRMTATLTASAPGATSYRWLKNGEPMDEGVGADGTLTVVWRNPKSKPIDTYQAIARYASGGVTAESEPSSGVAVEYLPMGTLFSFR